MPILFRSLLIITAYWLTAKLGLHLSFIGSYITLFWLPTGVAVAALLLRGWSCLPAIWMGALLLNLSVGLPVLAALAIASGNTLAPALTAWLLERLQFHTAFERARDSLLLLTAAFLGMIASSIVGTSTIYGLTAAPQEPFLLAVLGWWLGDILGVMLAAPLLLSLAAGRFESIHRQPSMFLAWLIVALATGLAVFPFNTFGPEGSSLPLVFLTFPIVVWAAVKFGLLGAAGATLWFAGLSAWSAHQGVGPFSSLPQESAQMLLAAWSVTLAVMALFATSVHGELQKSAFELSTSADRYRQMFDANPHPMWVYDPDTLRFLAVNESAIRHYGYSREEFLRLTIKDIRSAEEVPVLLQLLADSEGLSTTNRLWRHRNKAGEIILVEASSHPLVFDGRRARVVLVTDVTERMQAEYRVRRNETLLREAQHIARLGSWELQLANGAVDLSDEFMQICQQPAGAISKLPDDLIRCLHPDDQPVIQTFFSAAIGGHAFDQECRLRLPNGSFLWINIRGALYADIGGHPARLVGTIQDISSRKATESQIHRLAFFDSLTLLPNRRLLIDRLNQTLASSSRSLHFGSLLFIDLDHFKTLNDTQGHDVGDDLLVQVAKRIQACIRESDTAARLGGDEFVVMLTKLGTDSAAAIRHTELVAEKIRSDIGQPYVLKSEEFHTTPSIGIRLFRGHEQTVDDLLKHADVAMYEAKSAGRNTIRFYDPAMQIALEARLAMDAQLRKALPAHQLVTYFQAQTDLTGSIFGAEILLRWNHPEQGLVLPDQFIPRAEESGFIVAIGNSVLEIACKQLQSWQHDSASRHLVLAVNVSARQFHQADFVPRLRELLSRTGAPAHRLKLELTESLLLENVEDTIQKMHELSKLGISFSMDDFGTGHSSLTYIKRLPLGQIKIDRSFVRDITTDPNDAVIVQTIIAMARALGLHVIAEGVETSGQLDFLQAHGCEAFQGYLMGKPMPIDEFEGTVRQCRPNNSKKQLATLPD
jgi:diguanylate cyclase (GGDEF)-like protein/PAS domain S-box-containing protein